MAIEDILNALEVQAQTDIDAVLAEAREHAALVDAQAKAEAAATKDAYAKQVERSARAAASKQVNVPGEPVERLVRKPLEQPGVTTSGARFRELLLGRCEDTLKRLTTRAGYSHLRFEPGSVDLL